MREAYSTASISRRFIYIALIAAGVAGMAQVDSGKSPAVAEASGAEVEKAAEPSPLSLTGKVVVIKTELEDLIDGRRFKNFRDLLEAAEEAEAIVFDLNVTGSSPWVTNRRLLEEMPKIKQRTFSFVNPAAIAAGAIMAAGTDAIYMSPGGVIGGSGLHAESGDTEGSKEAFERNYAQELSVLKARARSLAKLKGHDPEVIEAFIDGEYELKRGDVILSRKGEILTLTAEEAVVVYDGKPLLAKGIVGSVEELLKAENLSGEVFETDPVRYAKDQATANRKAAVKTTAIEESDDKKNGDGLVTRRGEASFKDKILVLPIREEDLMITARFEFMERAVKKAKLEGASALIIDMNSPGGAAWQTAELMMKTMQETAFPTITFVNPNAVSAGSLIAVATDTIYMYPASNIGSALVVSGTGGDLGENMQQKVDQMMISTVRNVAELKGHNPDVAEAFVNMDKEVIIDGVTVSEAGTVLNLNANEATEILDGRPVLAKGIARTVEEIIELEGLEGEIHEVEPLGMESFAQWVGRFSFVLIIIGLAGAYMELQAPGFGVPGVASLIAFGLFFFGNNMAGNLAGYELAVILVLGLVLIGVEIFILPGTIIPGMTGAVLVIGALGFAMIDKIDFQYKWEGLPEAGTWGEILSSATVSLSIGILGSIALLLAAMRWLPESKMGHWMVLEKTSAAGASLDESGTGTAESALETYVGLTGEATTDLHPAGKGRFGDRLLDIISDGDYVVKGSPIRVVKHEGPRIVVMPAEEGG